MGMVTTHTEGLVVVHSDDASKPVEVVQLPARDAAVQAESVVNEKSGGKTPPPQPPVAARVADAPVKPAKASPAVKAAVKQQATRIKKAKT